MDYNFGSVGWSHLGAQQHIHSLYLQPCRMFMNFQPRNCPSSFAQALNMTAICDSSNAFPFFLEDDWFMGSDVRVTKPKWDSVDGAHFSALLTESLPQLYSNFLFSMVTCPAPAFSFIATKDGCIRRSSARTFRKNCSTNLEGSRHVSSAKVEKYGKHWKIPKLPKRHPLQRSHHKFFTRLSPAIPTVLLRVPAWN